MRFLLDENVPRGLATALSILGHDVLELPPELRAVADAEVLAAAAREGRVLVTLDTDFGTLVYLRLQASPPGVALIRLRPHELAARLAAVAAAMTQAMATSGMFMVIDRHGYRMKPLPQVLWWYRRQYRRWYLEHDFQLQVDGYGTSQSKASERGSSES